MYHQVHTNVQSWLIHYVQGGLGHSAIPVICHMPGEKLEGGMSQNGWACEAYMTIC
jgi:hypothetical protein